MKLAIPFNDENTKPMGMADKPRASISEQRADSVEAIAFWSAPNLQRVRGVGADIWALHRQSLESERRDQIDGDGPGKILNTCRLGENNMTRTVERLSHWPP